MANNVIATQQLSTFDLIRNILRTSSVLNQRFSIKNYYNFEPSLKSIDFKQMPYIVIDVPSTSLEDNSMDRSLRLKDFTVIITLVVSYESRDNYTRYVNAILDTIEVNESTLQGSGYYHANINITDTAVDIINQKKAIVGTFDLTLKGAIGR